MGTPSMGFDEEFDHFFESRMNHTSPLTSAADQAETLRTVAAIYRSAALGIHVNVSEIVS